MCKIRRGNRIMVENHLLHTYNTDAVPQLQKKFNYKNRHQVPAIKKVTINMGLGEAVQNPKVVESASKQLALIAGQKPVITRAKSPLQDSNYVKVCLSVAWLPYVTSKCGIF